MAEPLRPTPAEADYDILADFLSALAYPVRLELLRLLRVPHAVGEIRLAPRRGIGDNPERAASRTSVEGHLDKLEEADLVRAEQVERDGRSVKAYAANPLKLYALTEELRRITVIHAGHGPAGEATGTLRPAARPDDVKGPRLVLVYGLYEGKSFSLDPQRRASGQWLVGRRRGAPVQLDYDPYVSMEHALVAAKDGGYVVSDLGSKNGTSVNWAPLPSKGSWRLRPGDVVNIGRSVLSFVPA